MSFNLGKTYLRAQWTLLSCSHAEWCEGRQLPPAGGSPVDPTPTQITEYSSKHLCMHINTCAVICRYMHSLQLLYFHSASQLELQNNYPSLFAYIYYISTAIHLVQKLHFQRVGCVGRLFPTKTVQQNVEGNVAGGGRTSQVPQPTCFFPKSGRDPV